MSIAIATHPPKKRTRTDGAAIYHPRFGAFVIPNSIVDLNSFRTWRHSGVLPEKLKVHFLNGSIWMDLSVEEMNSHNKVKLAFSTTLDLLMDERDDGEFFCDGMLLSNDSAGLATEPDGMVVFNRTFDSGRIESTAGESTGAQATELVGTPDIVIEIISPSTAEKDFDELMKSYYDAQVPEYWLVDARTETVSFDILRHKKNGYVPQKQLDGWVRSVELKRDFRLRRKPSATEVIRYRLDVR